MKTLDKKREKKITKPIKIYDSATVLTDRTLNKAIKALKKYKLNEDAVEMVGMNFTHMYLVSGFIKTYKRRHVCLRFGYWCWKDLFEHPRDVFVYLKKKL